MRRCLLAVALATSHWASSDALVLPRQPQASLLAAASGKKVSPAYASEPTPAAKLLEVTLSVTSEAVVLLSFLRVCAIAVGACQTARTRAIVTAVSWIIIVQGSQRLQGVMQSSSEVINPEWYNSLKKPSWQPAPWVFPLVWIPLKILQTVAASRLWAKLDYKSFSAPAVVLFIVHICLGDVWNRQFFIKQRMLTGLIVIYSFWVVLIGATGLFSLSSTLSAALLLPTVVWVGIASALNLDVWWLNSVAV